GELVFHLAVAGFHVQLFGPLEQNLVVDQLVDHVELQGKGFLLRGLLPLRADARPVVLFHLVAPDLLAVHRRPHVGRRRGAALAARAARQRERRRNRERGREAARSGRDGLALGRERRAQGLQWIPA